MDKSGITPEDILRRARQILTPPARWIKHHYRDAGSYCAAGAIGQAVRELFGTANEPLIWRAQELLGDALPANWHGMITHWNDAPERTHEEVLRAFDQAMGGK